MRAETNALLNNIKTILYLDSYTAHLLLFNVYMKSEKKLRLLKAKENLLHITISIPIPSIKYNYIFEVIFLIRLGECN